MGRLIRDIAVSRGHSIVRTFDIHDPEADAKVPTPEGLAGLDGVIEFALPEGIVERAELYAATGSRVVLGTTGWGDSAAAVTAPFAKAGNAALLHGSNFSVGANFLFRVVGYASRLLNKIPGYDILVHEYHHRHKKDSPSGTALTLGRIILDAVNSKTEIQPGALLDRQIRPEELHVSSSRGGSFAGTHTVSIDSDADTVEISHTARDRSGFALGAVLGAEWLAGKTGVFELDSFFATIFEEI